MKQPLIALLTDFGTRDWFVGSLKGVIASIAPRSTVVDITHDISPGDVRAAAFVLAQAAPCFPRGTIHLAVVDPTVGSERKALLARIGGQIFLAPDNGLISLLPNPSEVRELANPGYFRHPICPTFHGRDVFAPAASYLARGVRPGRFGPILKTWHRFPVRDLSSPRPPGAHFAATVLYIDRFGNCITDYSPGTQSRKAITFLVSRRTISGISRSYASAPKGAALATIGSTGLVEIAVHGGSAADLLKLKVGSKIYVTTEH